MKLSGSFEFWLPSGEHTLAVSDMFGNTLAFERVYFEEATRTFLSFSGGKLRVDSVSDLTLDERGPSEAAVRKAFLEGALATSKFSKSPRNPKASAEVSCSVLKGEPFWEVNIQGKITFKGKTLYEAVGRGTSFDPDEAVRSYFKGLR